MYSEKLKEMKKKINYQRKYNGTINEELLLSFCNKEDIIGNTIENIYICWKEYCKEKNIDLCSPNVLGYAIKKIFNLKSKKIRINREKTTMLYYE